MLFWPFGTLLGIYGHFWIISAKNQFVAPKGQSRVSRRCFWAKNHFSFEIVRKAPDGPKGVPNGKKNLCWAISDCFGPLWTTLECWQACQVWPFLFVLLVCFFGTPCSMNQKLATHQKSTVHSFVLHLWYFSISGWLWKMPLLGHTETQWLGSSHWF